MPVPGLTGHKQEPGEKVGWCSIVQAEGRLGSGMRDR